MRKFIVATITMLYLSGHADAYTPGLTLSFGIPLVPFLTLNFMEVQLGGSQLEVRLGADKANDEIVLNGSSDSSKASRTLSGALVGGIWVDGDVSRAPTKHSSVGGAVVEGVWSTK